MLHIVYTDNTGKKSEHELDKIVSNQKQWLSAVPQGEKFRIAESLSAKRFTAHNINCYNASVSIQLLGQTLSGSLYNKKRWLSFTPPLASLIL